MVKFNVASKRAGANGLPVSEEYRRRRSRNAKVKPRRHYHVESTKAQREISLAKYRASLTPDDKAQSSAIVEALRRLNTGCLTPKGYGDLSKSLYASERRSRPNRAGQKCIVVPHGSKSALPCFEPATFVREYFPNYPRRNVSLFILERTPMSLASDNRLSKYFAVLRRHCWCVPSRFSTDFDMNWAPNNGLYVLKNEQDDVYVGWSGNIQKRIERHNRGEGAMFTRHGKWFRIAPITAPTKRQREEGSRYSQETLEVRAQEKAPGRRRVAGGYKTSSKEMKGD